MSDWFWLYFGVVLLLAVTGFYCMLLTYNLLRILIGLEILIKGVTLLIISAGHLSGRMALAQEMVITVIVIEVVVMIVAAGVIIGFHREYDSINVRNTRSLKG